MLDTIEGRHKGKPLRFAVRSSAWGEDSEFSFAGQYESVLNVPGKGILEAYRRVIARRLCSRSLAVQAPQGLPGK